MTGIDCHGVRRPWDGKTIRKGHTPEIKAAEEHQIDALISLNRIARITDEDATCFTWQGCTPFKPLAWKNLQQASTLQPSAS